MVLTGTPVECGRLFLDLNCAIHQCATMVLKSHTDPIKIEHEIINETLAYINKITRYARPNQLLYVAVDGIAPRAKMAQQRKRRFISTWREGEAREGARKYWDTNAITPGTSFMDKLAAALQRFGSSKPYKNVSVTISDSNEEGEGEAKIVQFMRDHPQSCNDVIYGLDADLIMLSLLSKGRIFLLREPAVYDINNSHLPFIYFDINALGRYTKQEFGQASVDDYVVLCFLMGNDFVPPLSHLKIKSNGIEIVMDTYKRVCTEMEMKLVLEDDNGIKRINNLFLLRLLELLKDSEDQAFVEADANYYRQRAVGPNVNRIDNYPTFNKYPDVIKPSRPGWRRNYYYYLLNMQSIDDVNMVCSNYMEGIEWTFAYYFHGCMSTAWYYRYNYSPTIMDLYNYLLTTMSEKSFTDDYFANKIKKYSYPRERDGLNLLMVLPPQSKNLLPSHLHPIVDDVKCGCVHMFPKRFKIDTYMKQYLWECHPCLPPVDTDKLMNGIKACDI
jgi:5'-3' exoribonuclease 1